MQHTRGRFADFEPRRYAAGRRRKQPEAAARLGPPAFCGGCVMLRVDGLYWTADFKIARHIGEAYGSAGGRKLVIVCAGDPASPLERLGPLVGSELKEYYSDLYGTLEDPAPPAALPELWARLQADHPHAWIATVEAAGGDEETKPGTIELSDRGLRCWRPEGALAGDLGVVAYVSGRGDALRAHQVDRVVNAIVDGFLRFLQKAGLYDPFLN